MSHYSSAICSDEELLEELQKLGYDEVSPDVFSMMKNDLADLIKSDQNVSPTSKYDECDYTYSSSPRIFSTSDISAENDKTSHDFIPRKTKKKSRNGTSNVSKEWDNSIGLDRTHFEDSVYQRKMIRDSSESCEQIKKAHVNESLIPNFSSYSYRGAHTLKTNVGGMKLKNSKIDLNKNDTKSNSPFLSKDSDFHSVSSSNAERFTKNSDLIKCRTLPLKEGEPYSFSKNRIYNMSNIRKTSNNNSDKNLKTGLKTFEKNFSLSDASLHPYASDFNLDSSQSLTNSEIKTIKRKVLRRRNGQSIITEEMVEIPSLFETSYPDSEHLSNSKSFSSDDLSYKSNSSTGSITVASPESSIKSSPSTLSLLSTRSSSLRIANPRKKKSDPVAMYGYYKKFWDNFKPPGEKTHDKLRWSVRDRMLDYNV